MKAAILLNAAAGRCTPETPDQLRRLLAPLGPEIIDVGEDGDVAGRARALLDRGVGLVIAAGGDGTVSAVASALAGTHGTLGILPCGTSNSVASALGIPADLDGACAMLTSGRRRILDTARCAGRTLVLHASIGLHAEAVAGTAQDDKQRWGVLAYVATAVRLLGSLAPFEVELVTDEQLVRCRAVAVTVANVAPGRTALAHGPGAVLGDDGLLDVTIVTATRLGEAVATGIHLLRRGSRDEPATRDDVGWFSCRRLRVTAEPPQQLLIDGEAAGTTPVDLECQPASLHVVAPPPQPAARDADASKLPENPEAEVEVEPRRA